MKDSNKTKGRVKKTHLENSRKNKRKSVREYDFANSSICFGNIDALNRQTRRNVLLISRHKTGLFMPRKCKNIASCFER